MKISAYALSRRPIDSLEASVAAQALHQKCTIIYEEPLTPGHGKATLQAFSAFIAEHGGHSSNITEVVCDMSKAFISGTAAHIPCAKVTVDWFHIVQTFTRALDDVRKKKRREKTHPKALRWAVLKNMDNDNLTASQVSALEECVVAQGATGDAWVIKEKLRWIQKAPDATCRSIAYYELSQDDARGSHRSAAS